MKITEEIHLEDELLDPEREDSDNESASESEVKSGISADLIRGHINTIILRTLYERDKYGYEIIEEIEAKSHGQYSLKQPTLYSALKRLESQGYINAYWKTDEVSLGGRRKYYTLTDSGREITERNQAEWEYSRTVIDNLISDRNFDFSQPAPTAVDFKILKNSTSRVPVVKNSDEDEREISYDEPSEDQIVEINREDATDVVITENDSKPAEAAQPEENNAESAAYEQPAAQPQYVEQPAQPQYTEQPAPQPQYAEQPVRQYAEQTIQYVEQPVQQIQYVQAIPVQQIPVQPVQFVQTIPVQPQYVEQPAPQPAPQPEPQPEPDEKKDEISEEQKKILHENYLKLISEPVEKKDDTPETPYSQSIDTEKLLYNNRPETERDYKNLINNLFVNTVRAPVSAPVYQQPAPQPVQVPEPVQIPEPVETPPAPQYQPVETENVKIDDMAAKAREDGLTIGTSENYVIDNRRKRYDLGEAMFKCSLIVGAILLFEFMLCFIFRSELGATADAKLSIAYPLVILAIAIAEVLLFSVLHFAGIVKSTKPNASIYISSCIIVTIISMLIIYIVAFLLNVNFSYAGDIMAKIVIPCIVALNISVFGFLLYLFSRR